MSLYPPSHLSHHLPGVLTCLGFVISSGEQHLAVAWICRDNAVCHFVKHAILQNRRQNKDHYISFGFKYTDFKFKSCLWTNCWPFSHKIGIAYLFCFFKLFPLSSSFLLSIACLHSLWWISIMARSPLILLISLVLYWNWQRFHTIMVCLFTARILSKQEWQICEKS